MRVAEPVLRERAQVQVAQRRVEHAVSLEQERERDPDRGRGQHVREEDDRLVLAHAADPVVEHERDREAEAEHHRHRQQQLEVVQQRLAELRVVDDTLVVVEGDVDRRVEVARVEAVAHDLHEREAEREGHRGDGGQCVEIGPERTPAAGPPARGSGRDCRQLPDAHFW